MITNEKRFVLIPLNEVTQDIVDACIQTSLETFRPIQFAGDPVIYAMLKWRSPKPLELWQDFPVYSDEEIIDLMRLDLNNQVEKLS